MLIQNSNNVNRYNSPTFKAAYETENLVRCVAGKGKRIAERVNLVVSVNSLTKNEARGLVSNISVLGKYIEDAKSKIYDFYPSLESYVKRIEKSSDDKVPEVINEVKNVFGDTLKINTKRGRSALS